MYTDLQVLVSFEHATKTMTKLNNHAKFIKNTNLQILVGFSHTATTIGSKLKKFMFYMQTNLAESAAFHCAKRKKKH